MPEIKCRGQGFGPAFYFGAFPVIFGSPKMPQLIDIAAKPHSQMSQFAPVLL